MSQNASDLQFKMVSRLWIALLSFLCVCAPLQVKAQAFEIGPRVQLGGRAVPNQVKTARLAGRVLGDRKQSVSFVLALRNTDQLADFLKRVYDPADPMYGHYMTPGDFVEQFGPTLADVEAVKVFALGQGLSVDSVSANRSIVHVSGTASAVERAFGVNLNNYMGADGRTFYAPDRSPSVSTSIAGKLVTLLGLDNAGILRHSARPVNPAAALLKNYDGGVPYGNGPGSNLAPADVKTIYNLNSVSQTGTGQTIALFEADGWTPSDITQYETQFGLPSVVPTVVSVDGGSGTPVSADGAAECTLDIDMELALAPGVKGMLVYEAGGDVSGLQATLDTYNQFVADDTASIISSSWFWYEYDVTNYDVTYQGNSVGFLQAENQVFEQAAAQGQTVCACGDDEGAYADESLAFPNVADPASQPYVLGVGGTYLSTGTGLAYVSESSWSDTGDTGRGSYGTGGGGGISSVWTMPLYQSGAFTTAINPQGSLSMRNVPDVSLFGDYDEWGYAVYITLKGGWGGWNGTSAACPLWAGFLACVNQARIANGLPKIGLANVPIYAIGRNASKYASDFHDINDGSTNLYYHAVAGYDNSTGWGSLNGAYLFKDLAGFTSVTVDCSPNPSLVGAPVTLTATITPSVPNGETVTFYSNNTLIGTGTTSASVASLTTSTLPAGSDAITASYPGDANFASSASTAVTQVVNKPSTTTGIKSSPSPSNYGTSVTFTAWVRPVPANGEIVTFYDGGTSIGTGALSGGTATFTTASLAVGSHSITAGYAGDAGYAGSTSSALPQTVLINRPATVLTSSANPSPFGASLTLTATISPAVPGGETVTFYDGAVSKVPIGTGKTSGGVATFATAALVGGLHTIWAEYAGDANNTYSWSASYAQTISAAPTTTGVKSSLNPSTYGSSVTLIAWVRPIPANGETVTFYDGAASIGTGTTSSGNATFTTTALGAGSHSITATYMGDTAYAPSTSSVLAQSVAMCHPITTLISSANPSICGAPVTFTATVSPSVPNGEMVTFYQGATSKAPIGTGTTTGGVAILTTSALTQGSHTIWAEYAGDANNAYSWSVSYAQTVNIGTTTTVVTSSLNPSTVGASIVLTATISPSVPNGETVTFLDGSTSIGTGKTSGGKATLTTASLAAGSHSITASYPGDSSYASSTSSVLTQAVNKVATTTGIQSSPSSTTYGASVTFTAWIRPVPANGEIITFYDSATSIGTGPTTGGTATFTTTALAAGSHSITAGYAGDSTYAGSTSSVLTQNVAVVHPMTTLTSSLNPSTHGTAVTFTATVSPSVPNGETVNFYDGATSKALIGTGTTSGGVATLTITTIAVGSHTIWADYVGDANHAYSWSSGLGQTVN